MLYSQVVGYLRTFCKAFKPINVQFVWCLKCSVNCLFRNRLRLKDMFITIFCATKCLLMCGPERTGRGESAVISKNVSDIFTILFLI